MPVGIGYWAVLKGATRRGVQRLRCNSKFCMQLRIGLIAVFALGLLLWLMQWRWEQALGNEYNKGFAAGKVAEQQASDKAILAMQQAYDATILMIEDKHLKEMQSLRSTEEQENKRVEHWNTHKGVGGRSHECINAQQLQELRESTNSTH